MEVKSLRKEVIASIRSSLTISTLSQCVTELVLNSLDAKATAIAVRVNTVNCQIQVIDTGDGITEQNLRQIGKFYMTNKCHKFSDLHQRSGYFGYRGEALASICNAANSVIVMSRTRESEKTFKRVISTPNSDVVSISSRPSHGTTVTVDGMFNKLPVRQKRFKQELELEDMKRALEILIVIHPNVSFTLRNNISGALLVNSPKHHSVKNALKYLHPSLKDEHFKFYKLTKGEFYIETLVYKVPYENSKAQYLYVNKRPVQCLDVQKFVASSYQKYFCGRSTKSKMQRGESKNKYPIYVININCPYSEFDLVFSSNKSQVNFRNMPLIIKCLEKIFSKFTGIEPNPQLKRKPGNDSGDDFQRSECRVSHIGGAVRGYAYKRKCRTTPIELVPTKDNYVIEDETKDDFENCQLEGVQDPASNVQKIIQSKEGPKETNTQIVQNENTKIKVQIKKKKKPLPIRLNTRNPNNRQKGNICLKVSRKKKNTKKEKCCLHDIKNKVVQGDDKSRMIVSQKHADQMAYLVEGSNIVKTKTKQYVSVNVSDHSSSRYGKELLMDKFLKCATVYKHIYDNAEDLEKSEDTDFQTNTTCKTSSSILQSATSALKMLHTDNSVLINQSTTLNNTAIDDDLHLHTKDELACFQTHNSPLVHSDITLLDETGKFTSQTNIKLPVDKKFKNSCNFPNDHKINTEQPELRGNNNNDNIETIDVTSKCVQTSISLENKTDKHKESAESVNYNELQEFRRNAFLKKMEKLVKIYESNKCHFNKNHMHCQDKVYNTIKHISKKNKFCNGRANVKQPSKRLVEKYNSDYDSDFTNLHNIPQMHRMHHKDKPYYFSYKDKTVKIFDCPEKTSHSFPPTGSVSPDYPRKFHLASNNSQFVPQGILPSCVNNAKFLSSFKSALLEKNALDVQPILHNAVSPGYETGLENATLSPIKKIDQTPQYQQQVINSHEGLPSIRRKCYYSSYDHKNVTVNTPMATDHFVEPYPIHKKETRDENFCKTSNAKRVNAERISVPGDYSSNPMGMNTILNPYHAETSLPQQLKQVEPFVSIVANYTGDTTDTNIDKVDANSGTKQYIDREGKNYSPETSHLKINFAGLKDTFNLENNNRQDFLLKNRQLEEIGVQRTGNDNDNISQEIGHRKIRKNVEFNVSFLDISSKFRNDTIANTGLKNTSFTSVFLSFNTKQMKTEDKGKLDFITGDTADKLNTSNPSKLFSLKIDTQKNASSDLFPTQGKSNCDKYQSSTLTAKPLTIQSNKEHQSSIFDVCNKVTNQKTVIPPAPQLRDMPGLKINPTYPESRIAIPNNQIQHPACADEWTKIHDQFGTSFYFNKRTGMTTFYSPKSEAQFTLSQRSELLPKGQSPVPIESKSVDKTLSPQEKRKLRAVIIESYENELLTVKWKDHGTQNDPKPLFDELYKNKAKLYEPPVPVAYKGTGKSVRFDKSLFDNVRVIGQVDCKFIAVVTGTTRHIILFDQHAVHERICLENLQKEYDKASWKLRHPVTLFLPGSDLALIVNQRSYLCNLGMAFDCLSNGIVVHDIPLCLWRRVVKEDEGNVNYLNEVTQLFVDQVLEIVKAQKTVGHQPPILENVIKMEACRGAIKFGQPLSREVCEDLISQLKDCRLPFQCAHGRPTLQPVLQLN